jgi:pyruvate dehydrogenase E2 component (dihydrolipoamide acetyltransferase)
MATAVIMPKFEMAQETGTILHWLKEEGDPVQKGEPILEVETDKVTMEVEAPGSGILRGISAGSGDVVDIGQPIAYLVQPDEDWSPPAPEADRDRDATADTAPSPPPEKEEAPAGATPVARRMAREHGLDLAAVPQAADGERITKADVRAYLRRQEQEEALQGKVRAVPAARRLARELGVKLEAISGSGPRGRIQSADVQRLAEAQEEAGWAPFGKIRRTIPLSATRRTIARRMTDSFQQVPQFTTGVDVLMSRALAIVDDLNSGDEDGQRVTLTAFLIKACAWALTEHPRINVSFDEEQIIEWAEVNVGVAVAIEEGLVVPVLHQADQKGLKTIAAELDDLAARARARRLTPDDLQGGTFTISNLGMFGVDRFTALINPPQAAILAVGRVRKRPHVTEEEQVVVQPQATFTLTADHRALDGAMAARFLATLQRAVERPGHLLA